MQTAALIISLCIATNAETVADKGNSSVTWN